MSRTKLSALCFLMAAMAFLVAAAFSLKSNRSHVIAMGFAGVAILFLINAFIFWRRPEA